MLTRDDVLAKVRNGELVIGYAFDCTTVGECVRLPQEALVTPNLDTALPSDEMFRSNFFGDRLGLSLGPILYSHRKWQPLRRPAYKKQKRILDLRESSSRFVIEPGELITVQTIERVKLGGSLAALIVPRLTMATAGLQVADSYIDPGWDGILQLALTNVSDSPYELVAGERIAICRFYEVSTPLPPGQIERFAHKSHHYGLSWARILDSDDEPMPFRKRPVPRRDLAHLGSSILRSWKAIVSVVGATAAVGALIWIGRLRSDIDRATMLSDHVQEQADQLRSEQLQLEEVRGQLPITGFRQVTLVAGQSVTSDKVTLRWPAGRRAVVFTKGDALDVSVDGAVIDQSGGSITLELTARRTTAGPERAVTIQYAVL